LNWGRTREAENEFLETVALEPLLEEPKYELIKIYAAMGKKEKIMELYENILHHNPDNLQAAMEIGILYFQTGHPEKSSPLFKDLGTKSATDPAVIHKIIQIFFDKKNRFNDALILLEGMQQSAPDSSDLHYLRATALAGINQKTKAIEHFKKVVPGTRFYYDAIVQIAFLHQEQGSFEEAILLLENAIQRMSERTELYLYLGAFYEEAGEFEKSITILHQGIEKDPDNAKLAFRLGVVYDKWGKKETSIEMMKKVIALDPTDYNAMNYLGYTYADMGKNLDEAQDLIMTALKIKPEDGYITDSLGWVYFKKGLFPQALKMLKRAIELVPDDPIILEHLGDAYLKMGDKEKALEIYEKSLLKRKDDNFIINDKIRELK
jgi:tetratricopeptide (TPR) repeat protein